MGEGAFHFLANFGRIALEAKRPPGNALLSSFLSSPALYLKPLGCSVHRRLDLDLFFCQFRPPCLLLSSVAFHRHVIWYLVLCLRPVRCNVSLQVAWLHYQSLLCGMWVISLKLWTGLDTEVQEWRETTGRRMRFQLSARTCQTAWIEMRLELEKSTE